MREIVNRGVAVLGLGLVLAACSKNSNESSVAKAKDSFPLPDPPAVSDCEPGLRGGRLVVATFGDPKTFNPMTENESSSRDIIRFMFSGLTDFDWPTQTAKPGLAHAWQAEADQKTWTFKLRRGLRWSDGRPLTADDVVFTFNDVLYNTNIVNVTVDLYRIDGKDFTVTKLDDSTVRIVTPDIYAPFLEYIGGVPILPKHILAKAVAEKRFESAYGINTPPEQIVVSGPFGLKQYKPGEFTLLERNPYYWTVDKKGQRLPYLDNVIYTVVPDMNAMSLRFLNGESDVHETVRPDEFERFKQEADKGRFQLFELGVGPERAFLWFNMNTNVNPKTRQAYVDPKKLKWFRNTKFRQAIAHSVDRPSIIKSVYAGRAEVNYAYISRAIRKWHNPNIPEYPYDLNKARALLKEIGIEDRNGDGVLEDAEGNPIEFVLNTNTGNNVREKVAVLIQDDLKKLGVKLVFQPVEFNKLVDKIDVSYDYDCILLGLGGGGIDPTASMNVLKSDGFTHFWFPREKTPATEWEARIDWLMNAQLKTLKYEERKKYFDEVQDIMAKEVPFIYTVSPYNYAAIKHGVGNVRSTVLSSYRLTWNAEELYLKKK
jgi:peptide/nickel transport system substrate-binding protein